jgi:3-oxoacyl-[acyl-carrier protein] reductase
MKDLRGKKALITGAASGIGRSIALALAREGADLWLLDIDETNLNATAKSAQSCGVKVVTAVCNLSDAGEITASVRALLSTWGAIHILINNAGILRRQRTHETTDAAWREVMAINLMAPMQLVHELLPTLLAQEEANIVNVCSITGLVTTRRASAYQTSKFGLVGFTEALRAEYGHRSLGVTALCPGLVRTPAMQAIMDGHPGKALRWYPAWIWVDADRIAAATIRAIGANQGLVILPISARLLWLVKRLSPSFIDWIYRKGWRSPKRQARVRSARGRK